MVSRRAFLKTVTGGSAAGAARPARVSAQPSSAVTRVGGVDLSQLEIIDVHVHPAEPITPSASDARWNAAFVEALLPASEFPEKEALRARLSADFQSHILRLPREIGYQNYAARVHGVPATREAYDGVVAGNLGDFPAYVRSILDREKIAAIVLQSRETEPRPPSTPFPQKRWVWTYSVVDLLQPDWARGRSLRELGEVTAAMDGVLETAQSNGCVGFKIPVAYYRPLSLERVEPAEAEAALRALLASEPSRRLKFLGAIPVYDDPGLARSLRAYQDFLLKHIYRRTGELDLNVIIHTCVSLHPALRFDFNSPLGLFEVFHDPEIIRAGTRFVLIHTGYPFHHFVASLISQFPNVYTDLSFVSNYPGTLEEALQAFLSLAPSEKIMHGSDSGLVPEVMAYAADLTRRALARVLSDFRTHYAWTEADCELAARNVMTENARRVYRYLK